MAGNPEREAQTRKRGPALIAAGLGVLFLTLVPGVEAQEGAQAGVGDLLQLAEAPVWRLFAVEYARSSDVPITRLVRARGAAASAQVDMSWYFFVALGHGRVVLVDCGTDALSRPGRRALRTRWSIQQAVSVTVALSRVGLSPDDVTDVVLTHHHWDHVGGLAHFATATVHVQRDEWRRVPRRLRSAVEEDGRLSLFPQELTELWPGFSVREGGQHTAHHVMVELGCERGAVIIASDAAYLYQNVTSSLPAAVTTDRAQNVRDVQRAARRVGADNVLPGHDPLLFSRHPTNEEGVAAICR